MHTVRRSSAVRSRTLASSMSMASSVNDCGAGRSSRADSGGIAVTATARKASRAVRRKRLAVMGAPPGADRGGASRFGRLGRFRRQGVAGGIQVQFGPDEIGFGPLQGGPRLLDF